MKDKFDSEFGDSQYFNKKQKCNSCHKILAGHKFYGVVQRDNERRPYMYSVCNKCRKTIRGSTKNVDWNGSGHYAEDISRPSIIDLLESYRERV